MSSELSNEKRREDNAGIDEAERTARILLEIRGVPLLGSKPHRLQQDWLPGKLGEKEDGGMRRGESEVTREGRWWRRA